MVQVDPTKIEVRSNAVPIWESEVAFQDMVAEQLRHAPWLAVSAGLHAVAILILWIMIPAEAARKPENHAEMVDTAQQAVQPPPKPKPLETKPEDVIPDPVLVDDPIIENQENETAVDASSNATLAAFSDDSWNTAVGMLGGGGGPYLGRRQGGGRGGAPKNQDTHTAAALEWLARHQDDDGKWDCDQFMKHDVTGEVCDGAGNAVHDVGVTGLALLAFLGEGNTMRSGSHKEVVKRGVMWLRSQQQDNGLFGTASSHDFIYDHAIASYAMCEAFGLSNYRLLQPVAQKAINYLESHRNPYSVWRYQPRDNDNDTSVTGWCIMAYESGQHFGLQVNKGALGLCATWLDQVSDATGRHGYSKMGEQSSRKPGSHQTRFPVDKGESMTAVGLFCRYFMGQNPKDKAVMRTAADLIAAKPPVWDEKSGSIDHYYWYYGTYALYQTGGRHWREWQKRLSDAVVKTQHQDQTKKNLHGSWDPVGAWGEDGGRVYSTAILALTLQAHYRYTPFVR